MMTDKLVVTVVFQTISIKIPVKQHQVSDLMQLAAERLKDIQKIEEQVSVDTLLDEGGAVLYAGDLARDVCTNEQKIYARYRINTTEYTARLPQQSAQGTSQLTPISKLLFGSLSSFADLQQLSHIDINNNKESLSAILSKPLGFKLRADLIVCEQVTKNAVVNAQADQLLDLVEIAPAEKPMELFEYEFCNLVSQVIYSSVVWKFKDSENANMSMFDYLFRRPVEFVATLCASVTCSFTANFTTRDKATTTKSKRPDFLCFLNGFLLFKGEQKSSVIEYFKAIQELVGKLDARFIRKFLPKVPFMFGYAAAGDKVAIVAIQLKDLQCSNVKTPTHKVLAEFMISNPVERVRLLVHTLNIVRVLRYYAEMKFVSVNHIPSLLPFIKLINKETTIENVVDFVRKSIKLDRQSLELDNLARIDYAELKPVYNLMSTFKNTTQLIRHQLIQPDNILILHITPVCYSRSIESIEELIKAVRDICIAIQSMHKNNVVHRDIRWANVIYDAQTSNYLLTDFEHSRVLTEQNPYTLVDETFQWIPLDHLERDTSGHWKYEKQGDILMLGELLTSITEKTWIAGIFDQISLSINNQDGLNELNRIGQFIKQRCRDINIDLLVPNFVDIAIRCPTSSA